MPLTTKKALKRLDQKKQSLIKEAQNYSNLKANYNQLDTDYRELQQLHTNITQQIEHLTADLQQEKQEKDHIQTELETVRQQLGSANKILTKPKPAMVTAETQTELTAYQVEKLEQKAQLLTKTAQQKSEQNIQIKGLLKRIKSQEKAFQNLLYFKKILSDHSEEIQ